MLMTNCMVVSSATLKQPAKHSPAAGHNSNLHTAAIYHCMQTDTQHDAHIKHCCCSCICHASRCGQAVTCVMAARCSEPSGFFTILMGLISMPLLLEWPLRKAGSSSFRSISNSSSGRIDTVGHTMHCQHVIVGLPAMVLARLIDLTSNNATASQQSQPCCTVAK